MGASLGVLSPAGPMKHEQVGGDTGTTPGTTSVADAKTANNKVDQTDPFAVSENVKDKQATDQCDMGDGSDCWVVAPRPQRVRATRCAVDERAKYEGILCRIFSRAAVLGERVGFDPDEVVDVMQSVIPYLKSEPMLIEDVPFDVVIVGDLHGQLHDLYRIFRDDAKDGQPGWACTKYVFLGNYVSRGRQSLEVVMALFCIKMLYPDNIFLLRGNHEFIETNLRNGFSVELMDRYDWSTSMDLFFLINETFCFLSIAAIVGNTYLCVHAGISATAFTRYQLRGIRKPFYHAGDDILVHDIVWSEPARGLKGTTHNFDRETSFHFGLDALVHAIVSMEVTAVFRGHTPLKQGCATYWHLVHSIFSCTNYQNTGFDAAVALVDEKGRVRYRVMIADPKRPAWDSQLRALDGHPDKKEQAAELTQYGNPGAQQREEKK